MSLKIYKNYKDIHRLIIYNTILRKKIRKNAANILCDKL